MTPDVIKGSGMTTPAPTALTDDDIDQLRRDPAWNPPHRTLTFAERVTALGDRIDSITTGQEVIGLTIGRHVVTVQRDDEGGHLVASGDRYARVIPLSAIATVCFRVVPA